MSLTEKIIKNTLYHVLSQIFGFIFPIILTPFILAKIGEVQFGLYVLVLGFIGLFNLFDLSLSSSFVVFISRYNVNRDFKNLNEYFNTGLIFYIVISIVITAFAYLFAEPLLSLLNIPENMKEISLTVYYIGLLVFLISGSFMIFTSVLISIQKMYITSVIGLSAGFLNLIFTILILNAGYGVKGLMFVQLFTVSFTNILFAILAKKNLSELRINPALISKTPLKEMSRFGAQMQVSKLATFASEKYDEFLLAYFSVLNNVTYFNVANKISRVGRLIPFQIIPQIAPVASELKAKNDDEKLKDLFSDAVKYLTLASVPVFVFLFVFSDLIIETWLGKGYELSSYTLKILVVGQLVNLSISAPGNSIIPNIGIPKFQMKEGLIFLCINIVLSFFLIKFYGILGAAFGTVFSTIIASLYIYFSSAKFFSKKITDLFPKKQFKPLLAGIISGLICSALYYFSTSYILSPDGRLAGIVYLAIFSVMFVAIFTMMIFKMNFIEPKDKKLIATLLLKFIPAKLLTHSQYSTSGKKNYDNELVSFFIVTHNRLSFVKKCVANLLPTLKNVNYEIIIIDNASDDGTVEFLKELAPTDSKINIVLNEENIGINSKSIGAELSTGDFIIGIDDDVIDFPEGWVEKMVTAYKTIPGMGYLASDVVQDETTNGAKPPMENYYNEYFDDGNIILEVGPTGGWCFMISREVYEIIGKLKKFEGRIFFHEDGDYVNRIRNKGLKYGILSGVKVYHATGEFHNKEFINVFKNKYSDFEKGDSFFTKFRTSVAKTISLKRYIAKIQETAARE